LTSFRILHLSDFHWSSKSDPDQKQIVTGLLKDIPSLIAEKKVDLLVFTPPHVGRDGGYRFDLGWRKQGYFWEWDWTGQITLNRKENFFSTVLWL
jgi:hypothetical protein